MDRWFMAGSIAMMIVAIIFFAMGDFDASRDYMIMAMIAGSMCLQSEEDEE